MSDHTTTATDLVLDAGAQNLLFRDARTANTFADTALPQDVVQSIWDLVKWAPTSGNTQPLRLTVITSDDARQRLVTHLNPANKDKTRTAPLVAVLTADLNFDQHMNRLLPYLENARDRFSDETSRHRIAEYNAILQAGYFILGVRAAGLAAGPMAGYDADGVAAEFFAESGRKVVLIVNIGYPGPDAWLDRLPRLEDDEVIDYR